MVKHRLSVVLTALLTVSAVAGPAGTATASPATSPAASPSMAGGSGTRIEVIATGLDNPRGLIVAPGGVVLVTEAGAAGVGPCAPGPGGAEFCLSRTGAVTAIWQGQQRRVVTGLPSFGAPDGSEVLGPHDIALTSSDVLVTIGLGTDPANRAALGRGGRLIGQLVRLTPDGPRGFADLARFEARNDPDQGQPGTGPDSNPFGLLPGRDGSVVATDAGGNDLLRIDRHGRISVIAVFPVRPTPGPGGVIIPMDFVPTTVVRGPDGAYYVGQLTGFPFPPGGARVWRVVPGKAPTVYADGFTKATPGRSRCGGYRSTRRSGSHRVPDGATRSSLPRRSTWRRSTRPAARPPFGDPTAALRRPLRRHAAAGRGAARSTIPPAGAARPAGTPHSWCTAGSA